MRDLFLAGLFFRKSGINRGRHQDSMRRCLSRRPGHALVVVLFVLLLLPTWVIQAQTHIWKPIGPWGGEISSLAIAPGKTNVLYALLGISILRSSDHGRSWVENNNGEGFDPPLDIPTRISVDPRSADHIYLGSSHMLWESKDGGQSWEVALDSRGFHFDKVTFNPVNEETIYATAADRTIEDGLAGGGLFRSHDKGETWELLPTPFESVIDFEVAQQDTAILFAVAFRDSAIYRSTDAAKTWSRIGTGTSDSLLELELCQSNAQTIYASFTNTDHTLGGLLKSEDQGNNWMVVETDFVTEGLNSLSVSTSDCQSIYATNLRQGIYHSQDGGVTWSRLDETIEDSTFNDIELHPQDPNTVYAAAKLFGIYASENGGIQWQNHSDGLHRLSGVFAIDPVDNRTIYMIGSLGILRTLDGGFSWQRVYSEMTGFSDMAIAIAPSDPQTVYAFWRTQSNDFLLRSTNGGNDWAVHADTVFSIFPTSLMIDHNDAQVLYAYSVTGVLKSENGGLSWISRNEGLMSDPVNGRTFVNSIAFSPLAANTLFAATKYGLFRSNDGAEHWFQVGTDPTPVMDVKVAVDTLLLYTSTPSGGDSQSGQLRRSPDGGLTWEYLDSPADAEVTAFAVDPLLASSIWIVASDNLTQSNAIYSSSNSGTNWRRMSDGLPEPERLLTLSHFTVGNAQMLFVVTGSHGLYSMDFVTAVESGDPHIPFDFKLSQNYPNPFSAINSSSASNTTTGGTSIEYDLSRPSRVNLSIYNIAGQHLVTLVAGEQEPGHYRFHWDGKNATGQFASTGVYFIQLSTAQGIIAKKMTVMP